MIDLQVLPLVLGPRAPIGLREVSSAIRNRFFIPYGVTDASLLKKEVVLSGSHKSVIELRTIPNILLAKSWSYHVAS